ncbi:MAG: DUF4174 domain-containing protein [Pseudomonadota bacterium]
MITTPRFYAVFLITGCLLIMAATALAQPLHPFQRQYRPLIIFTPDLNDQRFRQQFTAIKEQQAGFYERDMLRIHVAGPPDNAVGLHAQPTPRITAEDVPTAADLRQYYSVKPEAFAVILIGKDGGEKARWTDLVSMDEIFTRIDAMPMRQWEMQRR